MLLATLIKNFSAEEISKIRREFLLSDRSRMIFERIAQTPFTPPATDDLVKIFRISKANFYSICSEIVDECVRILAVKEEYAALKFFRRKFLYRPFVTELRREEKRILQQNDAHLIENFYTYVFNNISEFPIGQMDINLLIHYGKKLYRSKANPAHDDDLAIELKIIYLRICELPSKKKMTLEQMAIRSRQLLDPIAERAKNSVNVVARFHYCQSEWKACVFRKDQVLESIEWLEKTLELIKSAPEIYSSDTVQSFELLLAYERAMKGSSFTFTEALEIFRKYYKGQTPESSRGALYLRRFGQIAFLSRDYETVRKIIGEFERFQFVRTNSGIYIMVLLLKAMVNIAQGSLEDAAEAIARARTLNDESFFLSWEVQIRGLEILAPLRQKKLSLTEQLAHRNIKWLRSRRISLSKSAWIYFYQVIDGIIQYWYTNEPIRPQLLEHFKTDFQSEHPDFYQLLADELLKIPAFQGI